MYLTQLGIEINSDGGTLFYMAVSVFILSSIVLWSQRNKILSFKIYFML